jgi:hypothetical protein
MTDSTGGNRRRPLLKISLCVGLLFIVAVIVLFGLTRSRSKEPLARTRLADGRILQIEGVTYGTDHRIGDGRSALIGRLYPWLPNKLIPYLEPKYPQSIIKDLSHPGLVVWVNAIDPVTGTNVDCQSIRMELMDEHGDLFGTETSYWNGGDKFWRVGHLFYSYPRNQQTMKLRVTSWTKKGTNVMEFANPHVVVPAAWTGNSLPQQKRVGELEIVLADLKLRTNGGPKKYWETPARYWKPGWELRQHGKKASGWQKPEWSAEDALGNKGMHLGVHQPVLKYSATFFPNSDNREAALLVDALPQTVVTNFQTITWWSKKSQFENVSIEALGFFPAGSYVFSEGQFLTNPPVKMGPVGGGAPYGWTGQDLPVTPLKVQSYYGHYSITNAIIYLRVSKMNSRNRLAMRLRDEQGRYYATESDGEGWAEGIYPFIVKLPPDVTTVVPEIVVLKPVEVEFMVKVPEVIK